MAVRSGPGPVAVVDGRAGRRNRSSDPYGTAPAAARHHGTGRYDRPRIDGQHLRVRQRARSDPWAAADYVATCAGSGADFVGGGGIPEPLALAGRFRLRHGCVLRRFGSASGPARHGLRHDSLHSYFIGEVTRSQLSHYALALLAVAIAVTAAYLSWFHVITHSPAAALNRVRRHLRRRIARILDEIARALGSGGWDDAGRARLHRELMHLREEALTAKQQIDSLEEEPGRDTTVSQTCTQVFAVELAAERLARAALHHVPPPAQRDAPHRRILKLRQALSGACSASWANPAALRDPISRLSMPWKGR